MCCCHLLSFLCNHSQISRNPNQKKKKNRKSKQNVCCRLLLPLLSFYNCFCVFSCNHTHTHTPHSTCALKTEKRIKLRVYVCQVSIIFLTSCLIIHSVLLCKFYDKFNVFLIISFMSHISKKKKKKKKKQKINKKRAK